MTPERTRLEANIAVMTKARKILLKRDMTILAHELECEIEATQLCLSRMIGAVDIARLVAHENVYNKRETK